MAFSFAATRRTCATVGLDGRSPNPSECSWSRRASSAESSRSGWSVATPCELVRNRLSVTHPGLVHVRVASGERDELVVGAELDDPAVLDDGQTLRSHRGR